MKCRSYFLPFILLFMGCVSNQSFESRILSEVELRPSIDDFLEDWRSKGSYQPDVLRNLMVTTLHRGLTVPSSQLNVQAIKTVERYEVESLANQVMLLVDHPSDVVSATAAVAVIKSHPPAPHVAKKLTRSSDPNARRIVAEGLGRKIGIIASADLIRLADDKAPKVQKAALNALAKTKSNEFRALYLRKLNSNDSGVVQSAIKGLSSSPLPQDIEKIKLAYTHPHLGVRLEALRLLNKVWNKSRNALEYLAKTNRKDKRIALEASKILYHKTGIKNPSLAIELLSSHEIPLRNLALRHASFHLPRQKWQSLLLNELKSNDPAQRWLAANLLTKSKDDSHINTVAQDILQNGPNALKIEIAGVLAQRGNNEALNFLSNELTKNDPKDFVQLLSASRQAGKPTIGLVELLRATSTKTRLDAAEVLLSFHSLP